MIIQNKLAISTLVVIGGLIGTQGCIMSAGKKQLRKTKYPVSDLIVNRWSPRAFDPKAVVTKDQVNSLIEAAALAPSTYNSQPWRIIYGLKGTPAWDKLFTLLVPFNQDWVKNAGALFLFVSKKTFDMNGQQVPSPTHSLDTGAATENLQLQAFAMGLAAHGMAGFDYDKAREVFGISEGYTVEAMYAVGKLGDKKMLPAYAQEREMPSDRKPIDQISFEGEFKAV